MSEGIDIGDIQTRFNIDLSGLEQMVSKAEEAFGKLNGLAKTAGTKSGENLNKGLDASQGISRLTEQISKMNENITKQFSRMQETADKGTEGMANAGTKNATKMRTGVSKEVDAMVRDINAKMEQARAAQLKMQSLSIKRSSSGASGDAAKNLQFDSQIATAQARMEKYQTQAKSLAQNMQREFDQVPASLNLIASSMDANEAKINQMQAKLKSLRAAYANQKVPVSGDFSSGFKMGDNKQSLQTKAQIDKLQSAVTQLIAKNDALNSTYAKTEDRAKALKSALSGVNTELREEGAAGRTAKSGLDSMNSSANKGGGFFSKLKSGASGLFSKFTSGSSKASSGMDHMNRSMGGLSRQLSQVGASVFLYQMLGQGIMSLVTWLWQAAETNSAFAASFNQVRVNLLTAFYPIYTAVMPALTALMQGLATVTGYLASFIATLFGTTYSAAKQGASGLQKQVAALNQTAGSSSGVSNAAKSAKKLSDNTADATKKAKELQQQFASFDEINTLNNGNNDDADTATPSTSSPSAGSGASPLDGANFGTATGSYGTPAWMTAFADSIKKIASELWAPIAAAWDTTGQKVMDAWNYALKEIWGLIKSIGKSFLEVWTNGTGQKFVENILQLLADVLNIIGDIAKAFKDAWNDDGRGTKLIQSIFDMWNSIFELLHSIAKAFREAWNDGTGEKIAADILDIFTNIHRTIGYIADDWRHAFNSNGGGEKLISTILGMFKDMLDALNQMSKDTADWAKTLNLKPMMDAVNSLLSAIRPLTKDIWDGLEWGYKNLLLPLGKFMITSVIPDFIKVLADVLKILGDVITALKPLLKILFDGLLIPLAKWTGGVIAEVLGAIVDGLDAVAEWTGKHKNLQKDWTEFWGSIGSFFGGIWDNAKKKTSSWGNSIGNWWSDTSSSFGKKWNGFWSDTGTFLSTSWGKMKKSSSDFGSGIHSWWSQTSTSLGSKWNKFWSTTGSYLGSKWTSMKKSTSGAMSSMSSTVSSWSSKIGSGWKKMWSSLSTWFSGLWSGIKSAAKSGLNGVIGFLNGAIGGINWLWNKFTGHKALSKIQKLATGGIVGGQQMVMLNDGGGSDWKELFQTPEGQYGMLQERNAVTALPVGTRVYNGGETRSIMNMAGITHYAGGGVVGGIAKFFSSGWDKLTAIGDWLKHPITNLKNVISSFTKNLSSTTSAFTSLGRGMVSSIGSMAGSWIKTKLESLQKTLTPKNPGGSGVTRWAPYVKQALSANGLSTSQAMISKVLRQIQTESGGNPNAIQGNIGDINNRTGDLAKGLMQTISATFNAYAFKGHHNIFNGYDNLLAALNYAKHRYGSSLSYLGKGHGYENGGLIQNDGMYRVGEHNLAEMVLPLTKPARAVELMQDALSVMGLTAYDLVTPGIVNEPNYTTSGVTNSGGSVSTQSLSALDAQTIGSIIADTLKELLGGSAGSQGDADMDVALKVNDDVLGRVVIKAINKRAQKLGYNPLPN